MIRPLNYDEDKPDEESGTCPICLEPFMCPLIVQCGHTFCWACIQHELAKDGGEAKCYICRQEMQMYRYGRSSLEFSMAEDEREHPILDILAHKGRGRNTLYLVLWLDGTSTTWEPVKNLKNSPNALERYRRRNRTAYQARYRFYRRLSRSRARS